MKTCIVYGTRPEMIKLSVLSKDYKIDGIYTGQQPDLSSFYMDLMQEPVHRLDLKPGDLNSRYSSVLEKIADKIKNYDIVLVQGDTMTAAAAAQAAFHLSKKIGHIEAGLRTHDIESPFPEEFYRTLISRIATWNFCPTSLSRDNLLREHVPGECFITGNTVIDAISRMFKDKAITKNDEVIITLHRRENIKHLDRILSEIKEIINKNQKYRWILPVHPNPEIRSKIDSHLSDTHVDIVNPFEYPDFLNKLANCKLIITDSGGIQEEAGFFKKRVVICRESTERPEGIVAGFAHLGFENIQNVVQNALEMPDWNGINPYGDGHASQKIAKILGIKGR